MAIVTAASAVIAEAPCLLAHAHPAAGAPRRPDRGERRSVEHHPLAAFGDGDGRAGDSAQPDPDPAVSRPVARERPQEGAGQPTGAIDERRDDAVAARQRGAHDKPAIAVVVLMRRDRLELRIRAAVRWLALAEIAVRPFKLLAQRGKVGGQLLDGGFVLLALQFSGVELVNLFRL